MKRFTVSISVAALTFAIGIIATPLWMAGRFPSPNSGASPHRQEPTYDEVATYIANRVLALKGEVAGFRSISLANNVHVKENPFKPVIDYRHRVLRYKPVPDSEPPMEEAIYGKDGFTVVIWMVRGELTWKPEKAPVEIGPYKIDAQVAGPQQSRVQPVIDKIVSEAADYFEGKAQSNNGMHPTRDTHHFINRSRAGGRVMPGVRL